MRPLFLLLAALALPAIAHECVTKRSYAAKAEFKRANPCPATGNSRGACAGWEVDHVTPLKCGGPDVPANMQWLTIAEHRAKTAREAMLCRNKGG